MTDNLRAIYEGLAGKNPALKELGYEAFHSDMQNPENLIKVYKGLATKNQKLAEYGFDNFKNDMFPAVEPETPKTTADTDTLKQNFRQNPRSVMGMPLDTAQQIAGDVADQRQKQTEEDSGFTTGWKAGKENLKGGLKYLGGVVGETLDKMDGEDDWQFDNRLLESARKNFEAAPRGKGLWYELGSFAPQMIGIAAASVSAPLTAGTSLSAIPAIIGGANIGMLVGSASGGAMHEYDQYKEEKGEEGNDLARIGVGIGSGAAEYLAERIGLDRYMPKGSMSRAFTRFLTKNEDIAENIAKNAAKRNPSIVKDFARKTAKNMLEEGSEESLTEAGNILIETLYKDREDHDTFENIVSRMGSAFRGGAMMGGVLSPVTYTADRAFKQKMHFEKDGVKYIATQQDKDGNIVADELHDNFVPTGNKRVFKPGETVKSDQPTDPNQPAPTDAPQVPTISPEDKFKADLNYKLENNRHESGNIVIGKLEGVGPVLIAVGTVENGKFNDIDDTIIYYNKYGEANPAARELFVGDVRTFTTEQFAEMELGRFRAEQERRKLSGEQAIMIDGVPFVETGQTDEKGNPVIVPLDNNSNPIEAGARPIPQEELDALKQAKNVQKQAQEQGQPQPQVEKAVFGKTEYQYTVNEDGSSDVLIPNKVDPNKALAEITKHFESNTKWQVEPVTETREVPARDRFSEPTTENILTGIRIVPKQIATPVPSQDSKKSAKQAEPKYTFGKDAVTREEVAEMINLAETPQELEGLKIDNDPELQEMLLGKFPAPIPVYSIDGQEATEAQVKARIRLGKDLDKITIENNPELANILKEKKKKLPKDLTGVEKGINQSLNSQRDKNQIQPTSLTETDEKLQKGEIADDEMMQIIEQNRQNDLDYDNKVINGLIDDIKYYNNLTDTQRGKYNFNALTRKAALHGLSIQGTGFGKNFQLVGPEGNPIKIKRTLESEKQNIQDHPLLTDYSPEIQETASRFMGLTEDKLRGIKYDIPMSITEIRKAIQDIGNGERSPAANKFLDNLEIIHASGKVYYKPVPGIYEGGFVNLDEVFNVQQQPDLTPEEAESAGQLSEELVNILFDGDALNEVTEAELAQIFPEFYENYEPEIRDENEQGQADIEGKAVDGGQEVEGADDVQPVVEGQAEAGQQNDRFTAEHDRRITTLRTKLEAANKRITEKKKEFKDRAAKAQGSLFLKRGEQDEIKTPIDLTPENQAKILAPFMQEKAELEAEINNLLENRDAIINKARNDYEKEQKAQGNLFDTPLDQAIGNAPKQAEIKKEEKKVEQNPSDAQKDAGNYPKGHIKIQGFDITIENPKGSTRSGTDQSGKQWSQVMNNTYGYFKRTKGKDGDQVDVFIGSSPETGKIFVVDQVVDGKFDEHKVMLGFNSQQEAREGYLSNYEEGWQGLGEITEVSREDFKGWLKDGTRTKKPFELNNEAGESGSQPQSEPGKADTPQKEGTLPDNIAQLYLRRGQLEFTLNALNKQGGQRTKEYDRTYDELQNVNRQLSGYENRKNKPEKKEDQKPGKYENIPDAYGTLLLNKLEALFSEQFPNQNFDRQGIIDSWNDRAQERNVDRANDALEDTVVEYYKPEERQNVRIDLRKEQKKAQQEQKQQKEPTSSKDVFPESVVEPLVFHGTANEFDEFSLEFTGEHQQSDFGNGISFSDKRNVAESFAKDAGGDNIMVVAINLKNPATNKDLLDPDIQLALDDDMGFKDVGQVLKEKGFDGVAFTHADGSIEYVIYDPAQAKIVKKEKYEVKEPATPLENKLDEIAEGRKQAEQTPEQPKTGEIDKPGKPKFLDDAVEQASVTKKISTAAQKYGWTAKDNNGVIELSNSKGKMVARVTGKGGKYTISHADGSKILSGNKDVSGAVEKVIREYFYGKEEVSTDSSNIPDSVKTWVDDFFSKGYRLYNTTLASEGDINVADLTNYPDHLKYAKIVEANYEQDNPGKRSQRLEDYYNKNANKPEAPAPKPKRESLTDKVKKGLNDKEADRLDELRKKLRGKLGGQLNSGLDPETFMLAAEATGLVIKSGARQFKDYVVSIVDMLGEGIKPYLQALYEYSRRADSREYAKEMTPTADVDNSDIDNILKQYDQENVETNKDEEYVSDQSGDSEQDSPDGADGLSQNEGNVSGNRGRSRNYGSRSSRGSKNRNEGRSGGKSGSGLFADLFGEVSDNQVYPDNRNDLTESDDAGDINGRGNGIDSTEGLNDGQESNDADNRNAEKVSESFKEQAARKLKEQKAAEPIKVKIGDIDNIRETLPFLLPEQQDDVLKAETRFFDSKHKTKELAFGKGMLFTNGTGTGKTYTGLGIAKRFAKEGKKNILIVVPSQPKVSDWSNDAKNLGLDILPLPDTKTGGTGAVVTTYANFVENQELAKRDFDLIIYDESHRLMEEKSGETSARALTHYGMSNRSVREAADRLKSVHPVWIEYKKVFEEYRQANKNFNSNMDLMDWQVAEHKEKIKKLNDRLDVLGEKKKELEPGINERAKKAYENTKVVFLSATPFKGHKNLRYANGVLFDWGSETTYESASRGQSRVDPESRFFLDNFGSAYEWKYHRLQNRRNANADAIALQEIQFAEKLMSQGVVSGRAINSDRDYERAFPKVDGMETDAFNQAVADIYNYQTSQFDALRAGAETVFYNYNYTTQLLESLRTSMSIDRIRKHLDLGRKVVIFHRRKQAHTGPPFRTILDFTRINASSVLNSPDSKQESKDKAIEALRQADEFESKYTNLLAYEQTLDYRSAIDQITDEFGGRAAYINGEVSKGNKSKAIRDFNTDGSGIDIIVVQEESGKEGISLHDTTGKNQRVLMSMSMPISSTTALQIEGRIYRIGQETDAIFEYPLLGLDLEIEHFGRNINRKLSTTENLAVGEQSRDLIRSFAEGVLFNSDSADPHTEQGKGGKEYDKRAQQEYSEFRRAILVYASNQKKRGRRDQREGVDYYATPEPIGQKMVEWLGLRPNETGLEPSAGHGAISMWFPNHAKITAVEPSYALFSKLNARSGGGDRRIINDTFENLDITNKYNGIAMNPPFGAGGKTAIDHIEKAYRHLKPYGRIVALIPNGGSTQRRFENFLYGKDEHGKLNHPDAYLIAEIILPSSTFEQAGTSVNTKIVVIDKIPQQKTERELWAEINEENNRKLIDREIELLPPLNEVKEEVLRRLEDQKPNINTKKTDLSYAENVEMLFDEIEFIGIEPRMAMPETVEQSVSFTPSEGDRLHTVEQFKHTKTGQILWNVRINGRSDEYSQMSDIAKKHGPYTSSKPWNKFSKGFLFNTKEGAEAFKNEVDNSGPRFRRRSDIGFQSVIQNANDRIRNAKTQEEKFNAVYDTIKEINSLTGKISPLTIVRDSESVESALKANNAPEERIPEILDVVFKAGKKLPGFYYGGRIYIISDNVVTTNDLIETWLHEAGHTIVRELHTVSSLRELYNEIGEEINNYLPEIEHNSDLITKADEAIAYTVSNLLAENSLENILTGNVDIDNLPLPLQSAVNEVLQRFNEYYGTDNNQDGLRGQIPREGNQRGSREIRQYQEGTPGNVRPESLGSLPIDRILKKIIGERGAKTLDAAEESRFLDDRLESGAYMPEKITIEGKERHTRNSNGQLIHPTRRGIENFYKWFGDSKVVDEQGRPLVVYRGHQDSYNAFDSKLSTPTFTSNIGVAQEYADDYDNGVVTDVYLRITNHLSIGDESGAATLGEIRSLLPKETFELVASAGSWMEDGEHVNYTEASDDAYTESYYLSDNKDFVEWAISQGYDGIRYDGIFMGMNVQEDFVPEYRPFSPNQIKSATGNDGTYDPNNSDIRYRRRIPPTPLETIADQAAERTKQAKTGKRTFAEVLTGMREYYQEKDLPIKDWVKEVLNRGGKVDPETDPYKVKKRAPGRLEYLVDTYMKDKLDPLLDTIAEIIEKSKLTYDYIVPYLISKHAPERNATIRNQKVEELAKKQEMELTRWIQQNDPSDSEIQKMENKLAKKREEYREKLNEMDFAGVMPMSPKNSNGEYEYEGRPDDLANDIVKDVESRVDPKLIEKLMEQVSQATSSVLEAQVAANWMTEKQAEEYRKRWKYYVPLRGWIEDAAKTFNYINNGTGGKTMQRAQGRTTIAEDPLAYLMNIAHKAYQEQVDMEVKNALLKTVVQNRNTDFSDLHRLKRAYFYKDGVDPETGEDLWRISTEKPTQEDIDNGDAVLETYGEHYKLRRKEHAHQHEVFVRTPHGSFVIVFPKTLSVGQAFNNTNYMYKTLLGGKNADSRKENAFAETKVDFGPLGSWSLRNFTNFMKGMFTQYNIQFVLSNAPRDFIESNIDSYIRDKNPFGVAYNTRKAIVAVDRYLRGKEVKGELGNRLKEFYEYGGTTGHTHNLTPEEYAEFISKRTQDAVSKTKGHKIKKNIGKWLTRWNQRFEDGIRFAVFLNQIAMGKSPAEAAYRSRNATVDFNIRGKGSPWLGTLWAFFEVSINSLAKNASYFANKKTSRRAIATASTFAIMGFIEAMINDRADDDDDEKDYYNRSAWMRHNYLNIPTGTGVYITIALPPFWRGFKAMGAVIYDYSIGQAGKLGEGKALAQIATNFMSGLSPVDVGSAFAGDEFRPLSPFVPAFARPFYEIAINRDFMDNKIAIEPFTEQQKRDLADSQLHRKNVNVAIKFLTDTAFKYGGGDNPTKVYTDEAGEQKRVHTLLDWNPSKIEHIVRGYTGGTYTFFSNILNTAAQGYRQIQGEDQIDYRNVPFVTSFIRKTPESKWRIIEEWYNNKKEIGDFKVATSAYEKQAMTGDKKALEKYESTLQNDFNHKYRNIIDAYGDIIDDLAEIADYTKDDGLNDVVEMMKEANREIDKLKTQYKKK